MIDLSTPDTCKACGRPIVQLAGGHRKRVYCDDGCKMRDRRRQQAEEEWKGTLLDLRAKWGDFQPETVQVLEDVMRSGNVELAEQVAKAITSEVSAVARDDHIELTALKQQVQDLTRRFTAIQNVEEQLRTDTQARPFKTWLAKNAPYYAQTPFGKRFLDRDEGMPPRSSRARYEQLLRDASYSADDIRIFREAWKAMIVSQS